MSSHNHRRTVFGAISALAATIISASALLAAPSAMAATPGLTDTSGCIPTNIDNPLVGSGVSRYTDDNPTLYVRRNATLNNHEGEGVVIVDGDLTVNLPQFVYDYKGYFHLGSYTGGGSGAWPSPNALMLAVGGKVDVSYPDGSPAGIYVGNNDRQGTWYAGSVSPGTVIVGSGSLTRTELQETVAGDYSARIDAFNAAIDSFPTTGNVTPTEAGLKLTGDGVSGLQVFTLDYGQYGQKLADAETRLDLVDIPESSSIFLNVIGDTAMQVSQQLTYTLNGVPVEVPREWGSSPSLPVWGNLTQRLLWRFPGTSGVAIGTDQEEHSQFLGSILAGGNLDLHTSTNGRVIALGNLTVSEGQENSESRSEFHSFPFTFTGMSCTNLEDGAFSLSKEIVGMDSSTLPLNTVFTVEARITEPGKAERVQTLEVPADGTAVTVADLPAGTIVKFAEVTSEAPTGYHLQSAAFNPKDATILIGANTVSKVTLTNYYARDAVGGFVMTKAVVDSGGLVPEDTSYSLSYRIDGGDPVTVSLKAGESVTVKDLPAGATVTFSEATPPPVTGGVWAAPTISPESVTITAGKVQDTRVLVTNTFTPKGKDPEEPNPTPPTTTPNVPAPKPPTSTTPLSKTGVNLDTAITLAPLLLLTGIGAIVVRRRMAA